MATTHEYSDFTGQPGGIGYRLDIWTDADHERGKVHHSYTTNPDGSGLFFHNGHGGRNQQAGNGQFTARSIRQFQARTANILRKYTDPD